MRWFIPFLVLCWLGASGQTYRDRVNELSDPSMYGRGYYRNGDSIGAKYIESQYQKIGLLPFSSGYLHPFSFSVNTFPGNVNVRINQCELQAGKDFIPEPSSKPLHGSYKVFVFDKEVLHSKKNLKKLDALDFSNTIVVIDPRGFDEKKNKSSKSIKELVKMITAGMFNNPATITLEEKLTFGVSTFQSPAVIRILNNVKIATGDTVMVNIDSKMKEDHRAYNVAGFVKGTQYPDSFLFITAHYDHLGSLGGKAIFRGANDNASGVALILELAERVSHKPLSCSVAFVAFAGEEAGLIGSSSFVEDLPVNKSKVGFAVNFDIAGTGNEGIMVVNGNVLTDAFQKLIKTNDATVKISPVKSRGQAAISDHYRFSEAGIPAFYIYTLGGNKAYHDIYDVPGNLTFDVFEKLSELIYNFYSGTKN